MRKLTYNSGRGLPLRDSGNRRTKCLLHKGPYAGVRCGIDDGSNQYIGGNQFVASIAIISSIT